MYLPPRVPIAYRRVSFCQLIAPSSSSSAHHHLVIVLSFLFLWHSARTMSHAQPPHKSFARYASVLRENLIACDASLRKGEEDWPATLGRLNAAFVRSTPSLLFHGLFVLYLSHIPPPPLPSLFNGFCKCITAILSPSPHTCTHISIEESNKKSKYYNRKLVRACGIYSKKMHGQYTRYFELLILSMCSRFHRFYSEIFGEEYCEGRQ